MKNRLLRIGITHGDTNGIGYEVIIKSLSDSLILELFTPIIYGSSKMLQHHSEALALPKISLNEIKDASQAEDGRINIVNCVDESLNVEISKPTADAGRAAFLALEAAVADVKKGLVQALVTCPINKNTIQTNEFYFPGHTEYLQEQFSADQKKALMILMNSNLRVALVTGHLPLSEVPTTITGEKITTKLNVFEASLKKDFSIVRPKIAVLSLNPHAGDGGLLGKEEEEIIAPAIEACNKRGMLCFGPYAADGFFGAKVYEQFDGVLAMYHDQGLAPFKTLAMENGVNYTAGLPLVRTSPAHGTAFDIAGKNLASEESMREAIYAAIDIYRNRTTNLKASANPLRKTYYDRGHDNEKLDLTKED